MLATENKQPSVWHTRIVADLSQAECVLWVCPPPPLSTATASPGLCPTAEQIFVRSGASWWGQVGVGGGGWLGGAGQAQRSGSPDSLGPWKYSGNNASGAFPPSEHQGPPGNKEERMNFLLSENGFPVAGQGSGEGLVPLRQPRGGGYGLPATHTLVSCSSAPSIALGLPTFLSAQFPVPVAFPSLHILVL